MRLLIELLTNVFKKNIFLNVFANILVNNISNYMFSSSSNSLLSFSRATVKLFMSRIRNIHY